MVNAVSAIAMLRTASKPVAVGQRQIVGARNLVRRLIPVHAGVSLPERRERRLVVGARRFGLSTERLDGVEIVRVRGAGQTPRWSRIELDVLLARTNSAVNANPWALMAAQNAGGVGRHWPTAVPP